MTASVRIVSEIERVAKNGSRYKEVWCEITVGTTVFMRRFAVFA